MKENKIKLLLDTDIGDDIDDALTIMQILNTESVELVGVTTVHKNTFVRARMVKKLLSYKGVKVPVYAGSADGVKKSNSVAPCKLYLNDLASPEYAPDNLSEDFSGEEAVNYIISTVEKYGEELTLLAIGPLTNIAKAILKAPSVMKRLKSLVVMGGCFFRMQHEWNVFCDIEAAKIVIESGIDSSFIGIDVTYGTVLDDNQTGVILNATEGLNGYIAKMAKIWCDSGRKITLHDPFTFFYILKPEWFEMNKSRVFVETEGQIGRGLTVNLSESTIISSNDYGGVIKCAKTARSADFSKLFIKEFYKVDL